MAEDDDVELILQPPGAAIFVADVGIRELFPVKDEADPADRLGVGPGVPDGQARNPGLVAGDIRK